MNNKLKVYTEFTFGVGTGESDLTVTGVSQKEEYSGIDIEGLIGSGEIIEELKEQVDYNQNINLMVTPGYFYIGDRECYAFGQKVTQISKPFYSSGSVHDPYASGILYIRLHEVPDSMLSYALPDMDNPYGKPQRNGGAAPINVSRFEPKVLSDCNALWDTIICHDTGVNELTGYRETPHTHAFIAGEASEWPAYFSPLSRFSVCHAYWRENEPMLPPDQYYYDFEYNCIILYDEGTPDHEYIIEFEGRNEPFKIKNIDLSPIETWPGNTILCISPDDSHPLFKEEPYEILMHTSKTSVRSERIPIIAEVRSIKGNKLEGEDVRLRLLRPDIEIKQSAPMAELPDYTEGEPYCICSSGSISGVIIDRVPFCSGLVYEGGVLIALENRIDTYAYVRSAGYLCNTADVHLYSSGIIPMSAGYEIIATTDTNGIVYAHYIAPHVISSSFDIAIHAEALNGSGVVTTMPITLLSDPLPTRYALPYNDLWNDIIISGYINTSGEYQVRLPLDCISPSSVEVVRMSDYLEALYNGTNPPYCYPSRVESGCIYTSGEISIPGSPVASGAIPGEERYHYIDVLFQGFTPPSGEVTMMSYLDNKKITRGDSRDIYGY